ncbi:exodeoxyribonuclease V subunit beta [Pseudarthrobacter sp. BIM B-2242]|uniref:UvrD-helicase domain-containing protein n=1 Tax=Pseudarthrobacter sp. BIM B-2242 TaxID=2772401 RepID=UPI00168B940D|nr:UvrD-helicase domain-containing protein [Pseudarthrobacter sp. BIM B-2242]QOD04354.1 UvrD-helicase domain-containing protein [Pseudarthrobacter sp. BIM B-2242]
MNLLDNVTMVSASAGTGKTYTLTGKIVDQIAGGLPAGAIMATTFTKKAAGELRERIAARLLEQAEVTGDETAAAALRLASQQLPASLIGTVNGVYGQLLQEHAIDAGLSPALEIIGEEQLTGIFNLATDEILAEHAPAILPIARRMGTDDAGARDAKTWQEMVRSVVDAARTNLLDAEDLSDCAERSWNGFRELLDTPSQDDREKWLRDLRAIVPDLEATARDGKTPAGKTVSVTSVSFTEHAPKILHKVAKMGEIESITWEEWRGVVGSGAPSAVKALFAPAMDAIKEGLLSNPAFHHDLEQYTRRIFACAADCLDAYSEFKRLHGLMDFVDQETLVLKLARDNEAFRRSFPGRVRFLVVDEFQDTSPLQLELFLQLSSLVNEAVWVGDPKQAIYEFRGTDPELMEAVVAKVSRREQLSETWRSHQAVVDLSNAVFEPVFQGHGMQPETVHLMLPDAHADWSAGTLEAWTRPQTNDGERLKATAAGVASLLGRRPELRAGDVAILARSNADVESLSSALDALGVRASRNPRKLSDAREVQLARAGMAFVADGYDTVALAEIVALHPDHSAHAIWQQQLLAAPETAAVLESWNADPLIAGLDGLRERAARATPTEVFEAVTGVLRLNRLISSWSSPATRLRNLDAARGAIHTYYERCLALRSPATLRGFLAFFGSEEQQSAENAGDDVVNVLTYHKAKGLEWPVVVLEGLDKDLRLAAFGAAVEQDGSFDLEQPLDGRWIRFWPSPFPYGGSPLDAKGKTSDVAERAQERDRRNMSRLMYVGMTRAVKTTVLTAKNGKPDLLNNLGVASLVSWVKQDEDSTDGVIQVADNDGFRAFVAELEPLDTVLTAAVWTPRFTDAESSPSGAAALPARFAASSLDSSGHDAAVTAVVELGSRLAEHGSDDWGAVGSAVHAYLGTQFSALSPADRQDLAERIVERWHVEGTVDPLLLITSGDRFEAYLDSEFPGWVRHREAAIGWRPENQVMEGWIDLLLEGPEGFVLVDHKTYPGNNPGGHIREKYLGQMAAYRSAVLAATGKPVVRTLIHFPALGSIYEISAV